MKGKRKWKRKERKKERKKERINQRKNNNNKKIKQDCRQKCSSLWTYTYRVQKQNVDLFLKRFFFVWLAQFLKKKKRDKTKCL